MVCVGEQDVISGHMVDTLVDPLERHLYCYKVRDDRRLVDSCSVGQSLSVIVSTCSLYVTITKIGSRLGGYLC